MAYDRYDTPRGRERGRDFHRDRERGRYSDFERGRHEDRGFFERAGDEIASWFGDEEAERRRREDERMNRGWGGERDYDRDRFRGGGWGGDRERERSSPRGSGRDWDRGRFGDEDRRPRSAREYDRMGYSGYEHDFAPRGYGAMPLTRGYSPGYVGGFGYSGGYGSDIPPSYGYGTGTDRGYGSSGYGWSDIEERRDFERGESPSGRDEYRRTLGGSARDYDRNYQAWRQRQLNELDRDYDEYRSENQERFESDFGKWRQTRQQKRGLLGQIREHMDVVGSDGETVGKVDCVRGDRVVLTKEDSEDNKHHSIKCSMIDTVEGDQVRLDIPAEEAKSRFRDEDRGFFGRDEESENVNLERSFSGTYRLGAGWGLSGNGPGGFLPPGLSYARRPDYRGRTLKRRLRWHAPGI